jgi:ribonuclease BN (tRNA processing enzyme)
VELIVLGSGGTWPAAGGATSGYLLRQDGFNLWLDAGTGTLARLQEHVKMSEVGALVITHGHPDHMVDLYPFFYARFYGGQGPHGLPLYYPRGFFERIGELVGPETTRAMHTAFELHVLDPGTSMEIGPFHVRAFEMTHLGPALGYRIESDSAVLAYTGDTGPTPEIAGLARDADLLVAEATWQDMPDLLPFHLSARQAGEHAARAGAKRLMLTHIWPSLDQDVSKRQAAEEYDGEILLASEGTRIEVGHP